MRDWLIRRRFSMIDGCSIALATPLLHAGHWGFALMSLLAFAFASMMLEDWAR